MMPPKIILVVSLLSLFYVSAQEIHKLEPSKLHYSTLASLSGQSNPGQAFLDTIRFPMSEANSGYKIYTSASPVYLTKTQVDELKNSIHFPANSSVQTRAELDFLLEWQQKRTPKQVRRSVDILAPIGFWPHIDRQKNHHRHQKNLEHLFYIGRAVLGAHCSHDNYPHTTELLKGMTMDMRIMEFTVKYHLLRPRPYHLEPRLEPLARMASPAFASGHTLWAYVHALLWSELVPEKRGLFLDTAYEVGESREIMGIHYPSDEEAARLLAHKMLNSMMKNDDFRKDFALAKTEWK